MNLFKYAANNPIGASDRLGLIVNMATGDRHERINDAIYTLREMVIRCAPCVRYFRITGSSPAGNPRYRDLFRLIYNDTTPPYIYPANFEADILPNLAPGDDGQRMWGYTPRGQNNMIRIPEDVIDRVSSCQLASLILHEMIHLVNDDPMAPHETERPNAFQACTSRCVAPAFQ
jgi:hypothetical protein